MTAKPEKVVSYFYDEEIGNYCYGGGNPMRPHRARLVYSLLKNYGLLKHVVLHRPEPRSFEQLTEFHADDYIDFLRTVTPNTADEYMNQLKRFNMGQIGEVDCPVFDGVYEYCQIYSGGSVNGGTKLASGAADIAFNWSGGMHHAKKAEASGFCYVNDIVLGILELLKVFPRVLYVDIDIHHGDGVEEAFYLSDRVMTVSFHKYGEFFPGTGALEDIGYGQGKYYCVNVPLKDGMDDDNYRMLYEPIMTKVMEMFQPGAIVMCCGADSLSGDKLGCFNLSMEGHSNCIEFLSKYNVPMMVLGGGGYTLRNVARCWTYETGRLMGVDLPDQLPEGALQDYNYYLDTSCLRISVSNMKNMNTKEELADIKRRVLEHLSQLPPVPSAQFQYTPPLHKEAELPEEDMDARGGGQAHEEARRVRRGDESDDEEGPRHVAKREQAYRSVSPAEGREQAAAAGGGGDVNGVKDQAGSRHASPAAHQQAEVKQEEEPKEVAARSDMQAATLATSEALQGGGSKPNSKSNTPSHTPAAGRSVSPAAAPAAEVAPMDVEGQQQAAAQAQQASHQSPEQPEQTAVVHQAPVEMAGAVNTNGSGLPQGPVTAAPDAAAADTNAPAPHAAPAPVTEPSAPPPATADDPMQQD